MMERVATRPAVPGQMTNAGGEVEKAWSKADGVFISCFPLAVLLRWSGSLNRLLTGEWNGCHDADVEELHSDQRAGPDRGDPAPFFFLGWWGC